MRLQMRTAVVLLLCSLALAASQSDGYQPGRATYYDMPLPDLLRTIYCVVAQQCLTCICAARGSAQFLKNFPRRGPPPEYGFGTALYGSCGYTSQAGTGSVDFSDVVLPRSVQHILRIRMSVCATHTECCACPWQ